ncbi:MAG: hypothetical protein NTY09_08235 [bacterium]|nr:hypothetical protein [bacterium]
MIKIKITFLTVLIFAGLFLGVTGNSSYATTYSSVRELASDGSSEVYNAFLSAAQNGENETPESQETESINLSGIMLEYQDASAKDPIADILTIYPVASHERMEEFRAMDDTEVAQLLADNPPEQRILALIIARSPAIARAENAWRASLNLYPQNMFLQDLLARYQAFTSGLTLGIGEEYQNAMIQMDYPAPGMLSLRGRVVEIDVDKAYSDILRESSESIADTKVLLGQIRNLDTLIGNSNSSLSLLNILEQVANVQYIAGTRSFSDLVRLRTEQAKRRDGIQRLNSEKTGLLGQLAASMNLPATSAIGEIQWPDDSKPSLNEDALRNELPQSRQEIVRASLDLEKMETMILMTRREMAPDLTFGMSYLRSGSASGDISASNNSSMTGMGAAPSTVSGADTSMGGMGSGLGDVGTLINETPDQSNASMGSPSFMNNPMVDYRNSNYGVDFAWAAELVNRRDEMKNMVENMTAMALGMLEMQISTYNQGLQSERTFSNEVIPDAQATLDVVRIGYSGNENNFSDLIGAELTLLDARNELAGIIMNRRVALAEIERIVGKTIGEVQ